MLSAMILLNIFLYIYFIEIGYTKKIISMYIYAYIK